MPPSARTNCLATLLALAAFTATVSLAQGDPPRAFDPATAATRAPGTTIRIDLIGDSTQTNNAGYGRGFCANLTAKVDCVNMAKGGASTKTFREQGLWERSLQTKPDYMLIQFGHNDLESKDHLPRQTTMAEYESQSAALHRRSPRRRDQTQSSSLRSRADTSKPTAKFTPTSPPTPTP